MKPDIKKAYEFLLSHYNNKMSIPDSIEFLRQVFSGYNTPPNNHWAIKYILSRQANG